MATRKKRVRSSQTGGGLNANFGKSKYGFSIGGRAVKAGRRKTMIDYGFSGAIPGMKLNVGIKSKGLRSRKRK